MSNMEDNSAEDFSYFKEIVKKGKIWYKCTLCPNKEFQTKSHRKYHQYFHDTNKPKPYKCATCGEEFIAKNHYNYHLGTHSEDKPYKCPTCKKGFLSRGKLNRHVRIHSGKVFQCQYCVKKFATTASRKQHEKTHSPEHQRKRAYSRRKRGSLALNSRRQASATAPQGERPFFPCTSCDKEFKYAKDLKRHVLVHTGERKFVCLVCKEKHQRKDNLIRHIRKVHEKTEEAARKLAWEEGEEEAEPNVSPVAAPETSEDDTEVEMEDWSSDDGSSTTSESTDSETEVSTEDDDEGDVDVEMAKCNDEERSETLNAISTEEETVSVDAKCSVADSMETFEREPPSPEPLTIADEDDHFKVNEAVAEVIFNKDALVITRVMAKVDDEKIETDFAPNDIALDVGLNEESKGNVENIVDDVTGTEREGISFQEEAVDAHFNDYVYTTHEKATHINHDHSYAYVECATDTEVSNDSNLEATAAVEAFENEGELPNVFNVVFQNASSCAGEAHFDDAAVNENEKVTQLLFSLKEKPPTQQDREIHGTSVNDIIYSSYLERKQITKEFLSFLYSEDGSNKENDESVGNIMVTDEFGACKEMEAGGLLTFARNKVVHLEPLLVQKIILYSSPSSEPIFCTMQNTIIVNQEQQDDTIELHYWSATENDNANEEVTFNEDNSTKEEVNSNEENNWGSGFSLGGEATMDVMEPNYVVVGLVGPQDVQDTGEYHSNLYARNLEECTENSSGDASEGYCDYYGEPAVHQGDLSVNGGHPENQDYFRDFLIIPEPNTGSVPVPGKECLEKEMDKQAEGKVKLIQIPKKRQSSWNMNEYN